MSLELSVSSQNARENLAKRICNLLCVLGSFCMLAFGLKAQMAGNGHYAVTLYLFCLFTLTAFLIYLRTGNWLRHRSLVISSMSFLYLYFLATGGEANTGLVWCYVYPLVLFAIAGTRLGRWIMAIMIPCSAIILYFPDLPISLHTYSPEMKVRFLGSITFVSILTYFMEASRVQSQLDADKANERLLQMAVSDELTGTLNRRGIEAKVQEELFRLARDRTEMSLVLCDVDHFKRINDRFGHDIGDEALQYISQILRETVRNTDMVGRWGGEEFLIMLPNTSLEKGYQLIERVRMKIAEQPFAMGEHSMSLSISCGICSTRFFGRFDDLIKAADISLYEAKAQGRNCTRPQMISENVSGPDLELCP